MKQAQVKRRKANKRNQAAEIEQSFIKKKINPTGQKRMYKKECAIAPNQEIIDSFPYT